jgi:hypothetical protein
MSSATGVVLASSSCPAWYWNGPAIVEEDHTHVQSVQVQVIVNCPAPGRGESLQLELRRNGVVISTVTTVCNIGSCNNHSISAVANKLCSSSTSASYTTRYRTLQDDKFPWDAWVTGPSANLPCFA